MVALLAVAGAVATRVGAASAWRPPITLAAWVNDRRRRRVAPVAPVEHQALERRAHGTVCASGAGEARAHVDVGRRRGVDLQEPRVAQVAPARQRARAAALPIGAERARAEIAEEVAGQAAAAAICERHAIVEARDVALQVGRLLAERESQLDGAVRVHHEDGLVPSAGGVLDDCLAAWEHAHQRLPRVIERGQVVRDGQAVVVACCEWLSK
mmetsp:Transcript_3550/g.8596  ORF Transcript_3550/g.8596 Transcript_3550/m.8596 type:complete len:212 (-) Transcript_3550:2218-2853(-)